MAIQTQGQYDPICPYCGHKHPDAWDWGDADFHQCANCDKTFTVERYVDVTYNTGPAAVCSHCKRDVAVRSNGNLAVHTDYRLRVECQGSKKPAAPAEGSNAQP